MIEFWTRLDEVRAATDVLEHPFYVRWTKGELTRDELATYAGEYRHAVVALADAADRAAAASADEELARHALEERSHVELWDRFAEAVGADVDRDPAPETAACADSWTRGDDLLDHLVTLYVIEAAQPAIAEVKREGLVGHYGIEPGAGTEYFDLHAELDHEHAAADRELIEGLLDDADHDALLARARDALEANWKLLDGVCRMRSFSSESSM